jgi:hypothetical protein
MLFANYSIGCACHRAESSIMQVTVDLDGCEVGYHHKEVAGVDFVFVDHPSYNRPGGMYGDENGVYGDNQWRFKLLCQAALEAPLNLALPEEHSSRPNLMGDLKSDAENASEGGSPNGAAVSASASPCSAARMLL